MFALISANIPSWHAVYEWFPGLHLTITFAIVDDIAAIVIIAVFYTSDLSLVLPGAKNK